MFEKGITEIKDAFSQMLKDGLPQKDLLRLLRFIIIIMVIVFIACVTITVLKFK